MRIGIVLVDLQRICELDGGFPVLALGAIPLSALQILLLADVRIAVTSGQYSGRDKEHEQPKSAIADSFVSTCH